MCLSDAIIEEGVRSSSRDAGKATGSGVRARVRLEQPTSEVLLLLLH